MGKRREARYNKTITIRVTERQYEKYHIFCSINDIAINELARFALDKAVLGDKDVEKLIELHAQRIS